MKEEENNKQYSRTIRKDKNRNTVEIMEMDP